ncbi:hypothetical protein HJC23_013092 [Cyclotella cryptica]|uniref:PPIase cyclophilin-type domain-containing protein n=1 Tax=Cyclotella cryptica TaxID=29204 RepID=A0ABD3QD09_9STRA|eukprot:CCRYP_008144-RA/>CCRYP_008144-RA protein AED:0.13 eAED:0.20 QI:0/0/0/1/1/1/2/0/586
MLRSRANRSQRPSEPTDERSGGHRYGGYPSAGSMAVGSGDGSDGYASSNPHYRQGSSHGSLYHHGGQPHYEKKAGGSFGATGFGSGGNFGAAQNPFKEHSSRGSFAKYVWTCFLVVAVMALSVTTFYYFRTYQRTMGQLNAVRLHLEDHPIQQVEEELDMDQEENPQFESDPQLELKNLQRQLHALSETNSQYKESLSQYTVRSIPQLKSQMQAIKHQIEATLRENEHHTTQLEALRRQQEDRSREVEQLKEDYNNRHKSASGNLLIPQAGSDGHRIEVDVVEHGIETVEHLENYVKNRENVLWTKIEALRDRMGEQSRIEVLEWFGPGPHSVEIEVEYPHVDENHDPEDWPRVRGVFLVELAPLDLMPVAINLFLQQIHHKLWNGCAFVINAMHILQAGPHLFDSNRYFPNHETLHSKFTNAKLDKMPFQEYHEKYPHVQWTLGFAGRPAGPDFYINKIDNSKNHGPGGQVNHDLHEEADPCFGKIVQGMQHVAEIDKIPVGYDEGFLLKHNVFIVDARVVTEKRNPLEEGHHYYDDPDYHKDHMEEWIEARDGGQNAEIDSHADKDEVEHESRQRAGPLPAPMS